MKNSKCTCACYTGFLGIGLCTALMVLSMVVATVSLSKNSNIEEMNYMSSMNAHSSSSFQDILTFFDGTGGKIILLISFTSMLIGMWFSGNRKLFPIAIAGAAILYISMYQYYSIGLQIAGALIMVFAHLPVYSYRISRMLKLP